MTKRIALLTAGLLALSMQGMAYSADSDTQTNPQATPTERPASAASDKSNRPQAAKDDEAYQAKLKRCEGMSNASDKKACTDKAKAEHGHM